METDQSCGAALGQASLYIAWPLTTQICAPLQRYLEKCWGGGNSCLYVSLNGSVMDGAGIDTEKKETSPKEIGKVQKRSFTWCLPKQKGH